MEGWGHDVPVPYGRPPRRLLQGTGVWWDREPVQSWCSWLPRSHLCSSGHFIPVPGLHTKPFPWVVIHLGWSPQPRAASWSPTPREPNHQVSRYLATSVECRTKIPALMEQGFKLPPPNLSFHKVAFSTKTVIYSDFGRPVLYNTASFHVGIFFKCSSFSVLSPLKWHLTSNYIFLCHNFLLFKYSWIWFSTLETYFEFYRSKYLPQIP